MEVLLFVGGFVLLLVLAYWYIEVYTPRKHWREAVEETDAAMRAYGQRPPRQSPPVPPPPMADTTFGCGEHYNDGCPNCGAGRTRR